MEMREIIKLWKNAKNSRLEENHQKMKELNNIFCTFGLNILRKKDVFYLDWMTSSLAK